MSSSLRLDPQETRMDPKKGCAEPVEAESTPRHRHPGDLEPAASGGIECAASRQPHLVQQPVDVVLVQPFQFRRLQFLGEDSRL